MSMNQLERRKRSRKSATHDAWPPGRRATTKSLLHRGFLGIKGLVTIHCEIPPASLWRTALFTCFGVLLLQGCAAQAGTHTYLALREAGANACEGCGRSGPLVELFACELQSYMGSGAQAPMVWGDVLCSAIVP